MESINLNLIPTGANPVVHVSQYDTGRVIRFNIFEGSSVYFLDGTETISCNIKKPDNNIVTLSVTNTNDSYVEITTTEQATACDGSNLCEISITKGDDVIGSLNFIMEVERSPIEGGISSASEINNLWTQVDGMVADALATQYDSANVVFDNLPTAGHGIPYTVTSEGIGNAIDNALDMTDTASGAIATFESEYALPLRDLEIEINAVQESGTPTPSSPKLISGFTGANVQDIGGNDSTLLNYIQNIYAGTYGFVDLGSLAWNYNSANTFFYATVSDIKLITTDGVLPNLMAYGYTPTTSAGISGWGSKSNLSIGVRTNQTMICVKNTAYTTTTAFTNAVNGKYLIYELDTPATPSITSAQLAAICSSFNIEGTTTAISWNDDAGTVYGGSLRIANGYTKLVDNSNCIDMSNLSWSYNSNYGGIFYATISASHTKGQAIICECYQTTTISIDAPNTDWTAVPDLTIGLHYQGGTNYVYVKDSNYNDAVAFASSVSGVKLKYEVTTPTEHTLASTPPISAIVGTNNVFTDTIGDTSLEYYTKRGEQTVRIAEGVAVDVINNKSIDTLATTDKTVKGAINELDGILDGIKAIETLFVTATIASASTEYTTYNSRKFSDYDFYLFKIGASALDVRRTVILSKADWISGASINEVMLHGSTASTPSSYTASTFTAGYHSDTSFDANVSGSGSLNYLTIHGIRKN